MGRPNDISSGVTDILSNAGLEQRLATAIVFCKTTSVLLVLLALGHDLRCLALSRGDGRTHQCDLQQGVMHRSSNDVVTGASVKELTVAGAGGLVWCR